MVFVEEAAVMPVAPLIVRVEPDAGRIVTFDAATCVYPLRFSTGCDTVDDEVNGLYEALRACAQPIQASGLYPFPNPMGLPPLEPG